MSYDPPIRSRDTKDLLSIVENIDDWKEDALKIAREELVKRGYSIEQQKRRRKSTLQYKKRTSQIKANASFSVWGMVAVFVLAPFLLSPYIPAGETVWDLKSEGYSKKWKQRLALMVSGTAAWILLLLFLF
jgi:hypothetical protein